MTSVVQEAIMNSKVILLFVAIIPAILGIHDKYITVDSYDGYSVISVVPKTQAQLELLAELADDPQLDFWNEIGLNRPVYIMMTPQKKMQRNFNLLFSPEVVIENVQSLIDEERASKPVRKQNVKMTWDDYYNYDEILAFLDDVAATYDYAETEVIGKSSEGRDLKIIKLCKGGCGNKPAVWIDGGIHAREWISPAVTTYAINELTANGAKHANLLDNLDWYFMPSHNPDGYTFTIEHTRLWRKTRADHGSIFGCKGTDANRNYGFHWNEGGSSNDKCSDTYHGPSAFSEPESAAVRDYILGLNGKVKYFNSQHSFSQLILLPWGFSYDQPENNFELLKAADIGNEALKAVHGTNYEVGCIPCLLYIASGGSMDWALGEVGIPYSYGVELRDTGRYGFLLPREQILPTSEEMWAFHEAVATYIIDSSSK